MTLAQTCLAANLSSSLVDELLYSDTNPICIWSLRICYSIHFTQTTKVCSAGAKSLAVSRKSSSIGLFIYISALSNTAVLAKE
jgi:hypothetical protein